MRTNSRLFHGGSFGRHFWCLLLSMCVFCFLIPCVEAHGGGSGSSGSGSGSGSSGTSGSGSSGGHGGPGGSMGSTSTAPGGLPGNGSANGGTGAGHGGTGHGSGHASSASSTHGAAVSHNVTMAAGKNSATRNQVLRIGFTSDTMLARPSDRIRNRRMFSGATSTGGSTPETGRRKKLKKKNAVPTANTTGTSAAD